MATKTTIDVVIVILIIIMMAQIPTFVVSQSHSDTFKLTMSNTTRRLIISPLAWNDDLRSTFLILVLVELNY